MPRYGSRYARRYRRYKRFYRSFAPRRYGYSRKYVNATSKSSVRMKTTVNTTRTVTAGYGSAATDAGVTGVFSLYGTNTDSSAVNSPLLRTYCKLYEEMKVVGCKVNLAIVDAVGNNTIPSVQIYTAWDRKFGYGEAVPDVDAIKNSSTSSVATALNNNVAKLTRSCYASDLIEKATWFDSTLDTAANNYYPLAYKAAALNPNMFAPAFLYFLNCPTLGQTTDIKVSLSVTYYFAFRNPRFGGSGEAAKFVDLGPRSVSLPDDDEGDMDDGAAAAPLPDDEGDMDAPAPLSRRARSNASADLQEAAAPSVRRVRIAKNVK